MNYKIRPATRKELDIMVDWAAKEGWNPGLNDADVFWKTDPQGFIVLEKDGEVIGSVSGVSYNGNYGFGGFFIIKPKYRSQRLGTQLAEYLLKKLPSRLNKNATIGIDGVFNMQNVYSKWGFKFSHRDLRMEGTAKKEKYSDKIQKITPKDFDLVNQYDKKVFGVERKTFLEGWLTMRQSTSLKYFDRGKIKGYGTIRKCKTGYKIGPLFADSYNVAEEIFRALCFAVAGETIFLDTPEINKNALKLAALYKLKECFGCARMYYGRAPKIPYHQVFGVTTFELG